MTSAVKRRKLAMRTMRNRQQTTFLGCCIQQPPAEQDFVHQNAILCTTTLQQPCQPAILLVTHAAQTLHPDLAA
jgi:hypothetical protein